MPKPLLSIQELLEVTIFEAIRAEVVSQGYLPDINDYPNTKFGYDGYMAALQAITSSEKGFSVEVFNNSNPENKGIKKLPRIVVMSESYIPGEIGGDTTRFYVPIEEGGYTVMSRPPQIVDFFFKVHLVCDTAPQYRTCLSMLVNALPTRGYIPIYQPFEGFTASNLFIQNVSFVAFPPYNDSVLEYVYSYVIKDVWLERDVEIGPIAALDEVTVVPILNDTIQPDPLIISTPEQIPD